MLQTNTRIILVNTFHPGNIGAAARAMKTMGLTELVLVDPVEHPTAEATSRAAGAVDVLQSAKVVSSLEEALSDRTMVYATTARGQQAFARPEHSCEQAANWIAQHPFEKIAIVFGRERDGLRAEEIEQCQRVLYVPGNEDYSVLNMASAVQIVCYEIFKSLAKHPVITKQQAKLASQQSLTHFYNHLESELSANGYLNPRQPSNTMNRIQQLFAKAELTEQEVSLLRGLIKALARKN